MVQPPHFEADSIDRRRTILSIRRHRGVREARAEPAGSRCDVIGLPMKVCQLRRVSGSLRAELTYRLGGSLLGRKVGRELEEDAELAVRQRMEGEGLVKRVFLR